MKLHQKTARYCLKLRNKGSLFTCKYCDASYTSRQNLNNHIPKCTDKIVKEVEFKYKQQLGFKDKQLKDRDKLIQELKDQVRLLQDKLENVAVKAACSNWEEKAVIEIEEVEQECEEEEKEQYELQPLSLGNNYMLEYREEDGYVNVTDLCRVGNKKLSHWKALERTKEFLHVLSIDAGIPASDLIELGTGSKYANSKTWVHPYAAINIAKWISPYFEVRVSSWVFEIMITGKVDITNTRSYRQLQHENKDHKLKIQYLTKKYIKKQPRIQYEERYVVYILTTKDLKKDGRYIMGKAKNLTNRLSTYNKTDEHEVIYCQNCGERDKMNVVEGLVFEKLKPHREQANRERFILPGDKNIDFFIQTIKSCIDFVK